MKTSFFQTRREDCGFVIPATLVFALALLATVWDFVCIQGMVYRFDVASLVGLGLFSVSVLTRPMARRTLGRHFFAWSQNLTEA